MISTYQSGVAISIDAVLGSSDKLIRDGLVFLRTPDKNVWWSVENPEKGFPSLYKTLHQGLLERLEI